MCRAGSVESFFQRTSAFIAAAIAYKRRFGQLFTYVRLIAAAVIYAFTAAPAGPPFVYTCSADHPFTAGAGKAVDAVIEGSPE